MPLCRLLFGSGGVVVECGDTRLTERKKKSTEHERMYFWVKLKARGSPHMHVPDLASTADTILDANVALGRQSQHRQGTHTARDVDSQSGEHPFVR